MSHRFVAAKLLPSMPEWTKHGRSVAHSLVTTPFLALHVEEPNPDPFMIGPPVPEGLFIISSDKPDAPNSEYFTFNDPNDKRTLTVVPPLPFQRPLYLFVTPWVRCKFQESALAKAGPYQLDPSSLERLLTTAKEIVSPFSRTVETENGEEFDPARDSWSRTPSDAPGNPWFRYVSLFFDSVPFEVLSDNIATNVATNVIEQIALYSQLYFDYTWRGCRYTLEYIETTRKTMTSRRMVPSPSLVFSRDQALDPSVDAVRPSADYLKTLPPITDGDPTPKPDPNLDYVQPDDEEWEIASDFQTDEQRLALRRSLLKVASVIPTVTAGRVKVIALDCDAIIDSDTTLSEALGSIFPPTVHRFTTEELLHLYAEKEALLSQEDRGSFVEVIQEVARYLNTTVSQSPVADAYARSIKRNLHADARPSIASLVEYGYDIIALPLPGFISRDMVSQVPGLSLAFHDSITRNPVQTDRAFTWDGLQTFCRESASGISRNEILVVTSNLCAVAEPAALAGYPTMFIARPSSRSSGLTIPTFSPTFKVTGMDQILPILLNPSSVTPVEETQPENPSDFPPSRIRDCYQITCTLGRSYGDDTFICGGIQLATGTQVAMKVEKIKKKKPSPVLYEAAVYAQLEGVKGVMRIRWSGKDHCSNVIVMDRLGPNLELLRKFCRGAMSLKTVLMLGEQMLTTIEEVHARGIIYRDIKPENFAMGLSEEYKCLYLFDMGLAKLYFDPTTGKHMPFRDGRAGLGTPRYSGLNVHLGLEPSRRDDIEAIGMLLLYLFHGRLPWQRLCEAMLMERPLLKEAGDMKGSKPMSDLLARSPPFFTRFIEHCRSLAFEEKPDYAYLRDLLRQTMRENGWEYDWNYDWCVPGERGTLLPGEYKFEMRFVGYRFARRQRSL